MNTSVNELLSNPAFRPLVLLDVLAVFLMIICLADLTLKVNGIKRALSPLVEIDGCAGMPGVFI